jgi:hypothetical protein
MHNKTTNEPPGLKNDVGKLRWSLIPFPAMRSVLRVLEHGATKYAPDNWKNVSNPKQRYFDAAMRHLTDWWDVRTETQDTAESHLSQAICCQLFLLWFELQEATEECRKSKSDSKDADHGSR